LTKHYLKSADTDWYRRRLNGTLVIVLTAFLVLGLRLFHLQVVQGEGYRRLSENNCIRLQNIDPPRGQILDRQRRLLVDNRPSFNLVMVPTPGVSMQEAEDALDATLAQFLKDGVDLTEFERLKTQLRAGRIYAEDNIEGLARQYGAELAIGLTLEDVEAWPDILQSVTPEDVMAAAKLVFDRGRAVTGWLSPAAATDTVTEGAEG